MSRERIQNVVQLLFYLTILISVNYIDCIRIATEYSIIVFLKVQSLKVAQGYRVNRRIYFLI